MDYNVRVPELPDIEAYLAALEAYRGRRLQRLELLHPFFLRSVEPAPSDLAGRRLESTSRLAKRLVFSFEGGPAAVVHLMIAGRLKPADRPAGPKSGALADLVFEDGTLRITEAGTKRRASLHLTTTDRLSSFRPAGIDPLTMDYDGFVRAIRSERHTLKRALTDQRLIAGIGNAYSDEILHAARLSPFLPTTSLDDESAGRLFAALRQVLQEWTDRLVAEARRAFPTRVTAFRPEMTVHGKFGKPCPVCGTEVQRIRYAENECNYCPRCQTEGRVYADRALSRLLKDDWPRRIEDLERRQEETRP